MAFRPSVNFQLAIGRKNYRFTEHPAAKGMPYGQTGRRATVYQVLGDDGKKYALKVFTNAFRSIRIAEAAARLQSFAQSPGLGVCEREVLTHSSHTALIEKYPDLEFAVLMAWVQGETWQEMFVAHHSLPVDNARILAGQMTVLMASMEQQGLAHCDIAGPNVMVDIPALNGAVSTVVSALFLVDVEEMYGPGFSRPEKLPAGTPGYNHRTAVKGLWSADSDRFAGAVMLTEMLTCHDPRIRRVSFQEQYFDPGEMQQNTDRYQLATLVLKDQGDTLAADLFSRAWFSQTLNECPTFSEWFVALNKPQQSITINTPTGANPVGVWRPLGAARPVSNPPVISTPIEQIRPMLQKSANEGRWVDVLTLASQILQVTPADVETINLQIKAQRLIQLEQAIQSLWQAAALSGTAEDWENCIRTITTAQYQAKTLERYDQMRQQAEQERQVATRALTLEKLIDEKRWDEADTLRNELPHDQPKVAELLARMDMEVGNQLRLAHLAAEAQKAVDVRSWVDAIRLCRDGLTLDAFDAKLIELLATAQKEQALDQQVAEAVRLTGQFSAKGQWADAENQIRQAIQLQPQRTSLQNQLDEILQKKLWAGQIEQVTANLVQKSADEWLDVLKDIPAGFGRVDETRQLLHKITAWHLNLKVARNLFDLDTVAGLLANPPDSQVNAPQTESWLRVERGYQTDLEKAFRQVDAQAVEKILSNLHENHPLHGTSQTWLENFHKNVDELNEAHAAFDPERVQRILGRVIASFPRYDELSEWAKAAIQSQEALLDARTRRDLPAVEALLSKLSADHPAHKGTLIWLQEEQNRKRDVEKAHAAYDLDRLSDLLVGIAEDDAAFGIEWNWLKTQQQLAKDIQAALDAFDVDQLSNLLKVLPENYPYYDKLEAWAEQEKTLRAKLAVAQSTYSLLDSRTLLDALPINHPLRAGLKAWLAKYEKFAADLQKARQQWEWKDVLALLDAVIPNYPEAAILRSWAAETRKRIHLAEEAIASFEPEALEKLVVEWPQDDPRLKNMHTALTNMREKQHELGRLLAEAEEALREHEWQKAARLCDVAMRNPKISLRFSEIAQIARQELEKRAAAEKLMLGAQEAVFQKRYSEAIWQADQAAALLPGVQPYTKAGREMREKLIIMARTAEKNNKWNESKLIWAALKSAPVPPTATVDARNEPKTAPRESVSDLLAPAREALKAGQFEVALVQAKQANLPALRYAAFVKEIQDALHSAAQAAQNAGKWDSAKELWELLKKITEKA